MITTTLEELHKARFSPSCLYKIRDHIGVGVAEARTHQEPFLVELLLETSGLDDTLWVMENCVSPDIARLLSADYAEHVLHFFENDMPGNDGPRRAIEVARNPQATQSEQYNAADAAEEAAAICHSASAAAAAISAAKAASQEDIVWAACSASGAAAWAADKTGGEVAFETALHATKDAQVARLKQYLEHGMAAKDMPWPENGSP